MFLPVTCSPEKINPEMILIGSTPGDEPIKTMFRIPAKAKVDFMPWN